MFEYVTEGDSFNMYKDFGITSVTVINVTEKIIECEYTTNALKTVKFNRNTGESLKGRDDGYIEDCD